MQGEGGGDDVGLTAGWRGTAALTGASGGRLW